jgi:hypothetical protein
VAPPAALPSTSAVRVTGATSISRRKPNSRSHRMDTALNMAVVTTPMATTPGNTNCLKSTPPVSPTSGPSPAPSTTRKSTGCTKLVAMRIRARMKRRSSRCHTMATVRPSSGRWSAMSARTVTSSGRPWRNGA